MIGGQAAPDLLAQIDKDIFDLYHAGIGNDDSRMIFFWREFDALTQKENT